jgi:hypothetical protein
MVTSYLAINIGLLTVTSALAGGGLDIAVGFGLFAVLSIIRLRSTELDQSDVAYYFAALALGLIGGLGPTPVWLGPLLIAMIVVMLLLVDHPRLFARARMTTLVLDTAFTDERALLAHLGTLLGGRVHTITVRRVDLVEATTTVEVRYEAPV